jgi:hypothetical protein
MKAVFVRTNRSKRPERHDGFGRPPRPSPRVLIRHAILRHRVLLPRLDAHEPLQTLSVRQPLSQTAGPRPHWHAHPGRLCLRAQPAAHDGPVHAAALRLGRQQHCRALQRGDLQLPQARAAPASERTALSLGRRLHPRGRASPKQRDVGTVHYLCAAHCPASARSLARAHAQAYQKWGARFARHFEGEFAIAVFDLAKRKIFVSTDPFGVKPLFVALAPDAFGVSSCASGGLSTPPKRRGLRFNFGRRVALLRDLCVPP